MHCIFIFLSTPKADFSESQNKEIHEEYDGECEQNGIQYTEFVTGNQGNVLKSEKIIGDDDKQTGNDDDENLHGQNDENNYEEYHQKYATSLQTYKYEKKRVGQGWKK